MSEARDHCISCSNWLFSEIERDTRLCNRCADLSYDREQQSREWVHYHPAAEATHPTSGCIHCDQGIPRRLMEPARYSTDAPGFVHDSAEGPIRCTAAK